MSTIAPTGESKLEHEMGLAAKVGQMAWVLRGKQKQKLGKNGEHTKEKASIFGRIWGAVRIAQQAVPFVHGFMQAWPKVSKQYSRGAESRHPTGKTRD